jgi:hypothetical protein
MSWSAEFAAFFDEWFDARGEYLVRNEPKRRSFPPPKSSIT